MWTKSNHWGTSLLLFLLVITWMSKVGFGQGTLILPLERTDGSGCVPEGDTVVYQCTITDITGGGLSTIWRGTAFNCSDTGNEILLAHRRFGTSFTESCSNNALVGEGIASNGNEYTSQLSVMANSDLNGTTIECVLTPSTVIGNDTILVGAPPPQPSFDMVPFSFTPPSLFTVKWTDPGGIAGYYFEVIGDGCGCNSTFYESNILTANCSGWTAVGQTCTFELCSVSQDCGFNSTISTESLILQLTQPVIGEPQLVCSQSVVEPRVFISWTYQPPTSTSVVPALRDFRVMLNETEASLSSANRSFTSSEQYMDNSVIIATVIASSDVGMVSSVPRSISVSSLAIDQSGSCIRATISTLCRESPSDFTAELRYAAGRCTALNPVMMVITNRTLDENYSACFPVSEEPICYSISIYYQRRIVGDIQNKTYFLVGCDISLVQSNAATSNVSERSVDHNDYVGFSCDGALLSLTGPTSSRCVNGTFVPSIQPTTHQCSVAVWFIIVIIALIVVALILACIIAGWLVGRCWKRLLDALLEKSCWAIITLVILSFAFGFGVGVGIAYCCYNRNSKDDKQRLESQDPKQSPPPEDRSLYADPKAIEHEVVPSTGDEYAMIDISNKKKKQPQAASSLYQDPSTIEHESAPDSSDMYAVVDKPKRKSKKQAGAPDVVPNKTEEELSEMYATPDKSRKQKSEELNYADIDVAGAGRKKNPPYRPQAQPGSVAPVEYASVDHTK